MLNCVPAAFLQRYHWRGTTCCWEPCNRHSSVHCYRRSHCVLWYHTGDTTHGLPDADSWTAAGWRSRWRLHVCSTSFQTWKKSQTCKKTLKKPINTLRPRQNGRHFPIDIFKWIFLNENVWISINISLKFVPKGTINNIPTLVQVMAWRRPGDKPSSEPRMVRLPTNICVTRPQWVNIHSIQNYTKYTNS